MDLVGQNTSRLLEVGQGLEECAHHIGPQVICHLGLSNEDMPDKNQQDSVTGVADVPQPGQDRASVRLCTQQ